MKCRRKILAVEKLIEHVTDTKLLTEHVTDTYRGDSLGGQAIFSFSAVLKYTHS